jgi:hypothetical protein
MTATVARRWTTPSPQSDDEAGARGRKRRNHESSRAGLLDAPEIRRTLGFSTASAALHRRELRCSTASGEGKWRKWRVVTGRGIGGCGVYGAGLSGWLPIGGVGCGYGQCRVRARAPGSLVGLGDSVSWAWVHNVWNTIGYEIPGCIYIYTYT